MSAVHETVGQPKPLPPEQEALWEEAMNNPDYRMYAQIFNLIDTKGQVHPRGFHFLIDPFAPEGQEKEVDESIKKIAIPVYVGSGWYAFTYKFHLRGAESLWIALNTLNKDIPKKLMFAGPAHMEWGRTDIEYIPYHVCSSKTTVHNTYRSYKYPSHVLLPVIPTSAQQWLD